MPNKKKETAGLLVAVAPVAIKERDKKYGGGLLEDDRERYAFGGLTTLFNRLTTRWLRKQKKSERKTPTVGKEVREGLEIGKIIKKYDRLSQTQKDKLDQKVVDDVTTLSSDELDLVMFNTVDMDDETLSLAGSIYPDFDGLTVADLYKHTNDPKAVDAIFRYNYRKQNAMEENIDLVTDDLDADLEGASQRYLSREMGEYSEEPLQPIITEKRKQLQEGGDPAVLMPPPLPQEDEMVSDDQMEDDYLNFVVSQSLSEEEESYLMETLTADPQLSVIFDKVMDVATEFSGAGPVDGPGSEVSDSIPARLSDGEFVLTAKATDEIGPENLEAMMQDAEARADKRQMAALGGMIQTDPEEPEDLDDPETEEIRRSMLSVNPRLRTG